MELSQNILEKTTEAADSEDLMEQIELEVASIVREREERVSVDSNTSKKSEEPERVSEISNQSFPISLSSNKENNSPIAHDVEHISLEKGKEVLINDETVCVESLTNPE